MGAGSGITLLTVQEDAKPCSKYLGKYFYAVPVAFSPRHFVLLLHGAVTRSQTCLWGRRGWRVVVSKAFCGAGGGLRAALPTPRPHGLPSPPCSAARVMVVVVVTVMVVLVVMMDTDQLKRLLAAKARF